MSTVSLVVTDFVFMEKFYARGKELVPRDIFMANIEVVPTFVDGLPKIATWLTSLWFIRPSQYAIMSSVNYFSRTDM